MPEEKQDASAASPRKPSGADSAGPSPEPEVTTAGEPGQTEPGSAGPVEESVSTEGSAEPGQSPTTAAGAEEGYGPYYDPYSYDPEAPNTPTIAAPAEATVARTGGSEPPPGSPPAATSGDDEEEDSNDDGMLRMSFLEHLEELRTRILRALGGLLVAFVVSLTFADQAWKVVSGPASVALRELKVPNPTLVFNTPMEAFSVIWVKLPLLSAIFLAAPWILFQVWSFIAPGLYKRERRWAAPFVIISSLLFVTGGVFAYFVAFRFGLTFLLGIGLANNLTPMVTITEYFDLFINVMLGVGLIFELPVIIFFLTLLRIATPGFLIRNSRYAILIIVVLAAVVTPTPDIFNLMLFSVPMILLYFVGVLGGYILVLSREGKGFPWGKVLAAAVVVLLVVALVVWLAIWKYGFQIVAYPPFLVR